MLGISSGGARMRGDGATMEVPLRRCYKYKHRAEEKGKSQGASPPPHPRARRRLPAAFGPRNAGVE